jgi:hypothetical protein
MELSAYAQSLAAALNRSALNIANSPVGLAGATGCGN